MNKPKIRHCRNCQWHKCNYFKKSMADLKGWYECRVKYKNIGFERLTALLCRHYKEATEEYK